MAGRTLRAKQAKAPGANESGQAVVLSVVWMVVLLGMAGLVIDVGSWYRSQRNLQSQADAAALAGAQELPASVSNAGGLAQTYAQKNGITLPASGITVTGTVVANDSITVKVDKAAPTFFSKVFGVASVPVRAEATARNELIGQAQYVAPITVNITHPLLVGPELPVLRDADDAPAEQAQRAGRVRPARPRQRQGQRREHARRLDPERVQRLPRSRGLLVEHRREVQLGERQSALTARHRHRADVPRLRHAHRERHERAVPRDRVGRRSG